MVKPLNIGFLVPSPFPGSGGHNTIWSHAVFLSGLGHQVSMHHISGGYDGESLSGPELRRRAHDCFGTDDLIYQTYSPSEAEKSDVVIATAWFTVYELEKLRTKRVYFVQDFEHLFNPVGSEYLMAERTYSMVGSFITVGTGLARKLQTKGAEVRATPFGVDKSLYQRQPIGMREKAVVCLYQPEKPRRCGRLMKDVLAEFRERNPDYTIMAYGGDPMGYPAHIDLGIVPERKLGSIFGSVSIGLSFSSTNPSRTAFEMAACGLRVLELRTEFSGVDFRRTTVTLTDPEVGPALENLEKIASLARLQIRELPKISDSARNFPSKADENIAFEAGLNSLLGRRLLQSSLG